MDAKKQYFGTDGIRGNVGIAPITPEFMLKLGWAVGIALVRQTPEKNCKVLIGKDTRLSGYMLESALESGLLAAGVDVVLLGPLPTPGIAYLTRELKADAGIVISASHNPHYDNGIKLFSSRGEKLSDAFELQIESTLNEPLQTVDCASLGKATRLDHALALYRKFCLSHFPSLCLEGLSCVIDCAHGATYQIAPDIFESIGLRVIPLHVTPNGLNINAEAGSTHPRYLQEAVLANQADFGIAFDGDGDRVIFVDAQGDILDGDKCLFIIANHLCDQGLPPKGIVGTVMSNMGLEAALHERHIPFIRAHVGDRFVHQQLCAQGWSLGGESSGHLLNLDLSTTGDGILTALQVINAIQLSRKPLHELAALMPTFPQRLENIRLPQSSMLTKNALQALLVDERVLQVVADAEHQLQPYGRVLLRPSGTEPLLRIMVEGESLEKVDHCVASIAAILDLVIDEFSTAEMECTS